MKRPVKNKWLHKIKCTPIENVSACEIINGSMTIDTGIVLERGYFKNKLEIEIFQTSTANLWNAKIGNGFYHWFTTKEDCILKAQERVKEIITGHMDRHFKNLRKQLKKDGKL